jgi:MoaA/NifB/PqqE/SkfB family radical SAM enzyme
MDVEQKPGEHDSGAPSQFRIDVPLHQLLMNGPKSKAETASTGAEVLTLPEPVFPQRPAGPDYTDREYNKLNAIRGWKGWAVPYFKSRWHSKELRPIIAYLFTEFKCNVDCHYCWSYNNKVKGMTEDMARRSIDWLHDIGCRVLALMGGEPLLRPDFVHKVIYYASKKDFFVYLPTNGRLMTPGVLDRLGDAGVANINLAIDAVNEKPGLPKALNRIQTYFDYMVKKKHYYGYTAMININITHINQEDVKELTAIAHDNDLATDYHINEAPMLQQDHFKHLDGNTTYLLPEDHPKVDALIEWVIEKHKNGYKMPNPVFHLREMKKLMRGKVDAWPCRAGQNSLIVRTDGTLAPCFPTYSSTYDWGTVANHKFQTGQLTEMKKECSQHCLSTCNYILSYCYDNTRVLKWLAKQAFRGFQGVSGAFD